MSILFYSRFECFSWRVESLLVHLVLSTLHGEVLFKEDAVCERRRSGIRKAPLTHPQDLDRPRQRRP